MKTQIQPKPHRVAVRAELAPPAETPVLSFAQWVDRYALAVMEAEGYAPSTLSLEPVRDVA